MKNDDVIRLIKEQIEGYRSELKVDEVGYVLQVADGIARLYGLDGKTARERALAIVGGFWRQRCKIVS